jgi:hypothetical protein
MPNRMRTLSTLVPTLLLMLLAPLTARGQAGSTDLPLFADDTALSLRIEAPFRTLFRNRRDREELDGVLTYTDSAGRDVTLDLEIRTRGNSRMDVCTFPPLRLNLRRRQVEGTVFAGQNQLKLVTLCKNQSSYRDYLALEYMLYSLFALLSDQSYRVRWVEIDYVDTDRRRARPDTRSGFLIEEDTELAARTGMETWRAESIDLATLDPVQTTRVALFHFLVGNTDWAGTEGPTGERCCHNGDLFRDAAGQAVVVPYDFDQSGVIDADYASPAESLPIRNVTQRLYRGYCLHNEFIDDVVRELMNRRSDVDALVESADVQERTRARVLRYIEAFYEILEDPAERAKRIDGACRG